MSVYPHVAMQSSGEDAEDYDEQEDPQNYGLLGDLMSSKGFPEVELTTDPLPEDIYGLAIGSLIRDVADTKQHGPIKACRIVVALVVFGLVYSVQIFLVVQTKKIVSPEQVHNARVRYSQYEAHMYTDQAGVQHTYNSSAGYARGLSPAYFNVAQFDTLPNKIKADICQVPLSNVPFLFVILLIWGMTVLSHIRKTANWIIRIYMLESRDYDDFSEALVDVDDGVEVTGMPCLLKNVIVFFVLLPKIGLCIFMLWLGARWLTATMGFGNLLLNAVALAYIFDLADLVFTAIVPHHTKLLATTTMLPHVGGKFEAENPCRMFGLLSLGIFAAVLALLYIYKLQQVLPEYKWDVARVCTQYLEVALAV